MRSRRRRRGSGLVYMILFAMLTGFAAFAILSMEFPSPERNIARTLPTAVMDGVDALPPPPEP